MCEAKGEGLVRYPTSLAPVSGSVTVTTQCVDNAQTTDSNTLKVMCDSHGNWVPRHAHFTRMRSLRGHFGWQKRAGGKAVRRVFPMASHVGSTASSYYRHLGMHGKSATMKNWAA